ncbi:MAG: hypothetical protein AB9880_01055 [Christensenellales bacterium]
MYTNSDLEDIGAQLRKRALLWLLPLLLMLAALIYTLIIRHEVLTIVVFVLMGWVVVFSYGLSLSPLLAYQKFLRQLLSGRKREMSGRFKGFEGEMVLRDKVRCLPLMLNVGDPEEPKDDRLLYWDANMPLPDWQAGDRLWLETFDKSVTAWRRE